jgi:hypothetical protein
METSGANQSTSAGDATSMRMHGSKGDGMVHRVVAFLTLQVTAWKRVKLREI